MHHIKTRGRKAFTLIEIIVTLVIIGILSAIAIAGYSSLTDRAEAKSAETTLGTIDREYRALDAFNSPADGTEGVAAGQMTVFDNVTYHDGGDGTLEAGDTATISIPNSTWVGTCGIQFGSATTPGIIWVDADSDGTVDVGEWTDTDIDGVLDAEESTGCS